MTTIIVIVVVALVFFVTVCVVTFMVWKRETEMRTDSIRAIETNLEKLGDRLTGETGSGAQHRGGGMQEGYADESAAYDGDANGWIPRGSVGERILRGGGRSGRGNVRTGHYGGRGEESPDPFAWVHGTEETAESDVDAADDTVARTDTADTGIREDDREILRDTAGTEIPETDLKENDDICREDVPETHADGEAGEDAAAVTDDAFFEKFGMTDDAYSEEPADDTGHEDAEAEDPGIGHPEDADIDIEEIDLDGLNEMLAAGEADGEERRSGDAGNNRNIGRSGKRYTSEELDMIIRE